MLDLNSQVYWRLVHRTQDYIGRYCWKRSTTDIEHGPLAAAMLTDLAELELTSYYKSTLVKLITTVDLPIQGTFLAAIYRKPLYPEPTEASVSFRLESTAEEPLNHSQRGLVISTPIELGEGTVRLKSPMLDPQELRFSLLFWDALDFPTNDRFSIGIQGEAEELVRSGILRRTKLAIDGPAMPPAFFALRSHAAAYQALDQAQPGRWSLGRGINSVAFADEEIIPNAGLVFSLIEAIPVPELNVSLYQVLEFKSARSAELTRLRVHLEEMYQNILKAPGADWAKTTTFSKLDSAIADVIRVSRESKFPLKLSKIDLKLSIGDIGAIVAPIIAGEQHHLPLTAKLVFGAGGLALSKLSVGVGLRDKRDTTTPFEYVVQIDKAFA